MKSPGDAGPHEHGVLAVVTGGKIDEHALTDVPPHADGARELTARDFRRARRLVARDGGGVAEHFAEKLQVYAGVVHTGHGEAHDVVELDSVLPPDDRVREVDVRVDRPEPLARDRVSG